MGSGIRRLVEEIRGWVRQAPDRGYILEEDVEHPEAIRRQGWLPDAVFRRWAPSSPLRDAVPNLRGASSRPSPGIAIHPNFKANLPESYIELVEHYGSLHWIAPFDYTGEVTHEVCNTGPTAFLALGWPGYFDLELLFDSSAAQSLDPSAVDGFFVFHDGYTFGSAFDARIRDARGQPQVVEGFDDHTIADFIRVPRKEAAQGFEVWLRGRFDRTVAALEHR